MILCLIGIFLSFTITEAQDKMTADMIIDSAESISKVVSSKSLIKQISISPSGKERVSRMELYSKGDNNKTLMIYLEPSTIKGMKMLMLNDGNDIWTFSPRTGRSRKIAGNLKKGSMNSSDFSYEDMSMNDLKKDYNIKREADEKWNNKKCYVLVFIPKKNTETSYSKTKSWISKENFVMLKSEFWDKDGELIKQMTLSEIKTIEGHVTPMVVTMKNLQKESETILKTEKIEYNIKIDDRFFSQKNLKR